MPEPWDPRPPQRSGGRDDNAKRVADGGCEQGPLDGGARGAGYGPSYERPNRANMLAEAVRAYIEGACEDDFAYMKAALAAYDSGYPTAWRFKEGQLVRAED